VKIRELTSEDLPFLREMLYAAAAWRPDPGLPPFELVIDHPQLAIFHAEWGREGDAGLVAEEAGERIGAVWWRFFTDVEHGEGFVDESTPELAIAVRDDHRGSGVGRALMEAMHELGRRKGIHRVSLSVDAENPAKRLYAALGYVEYEPQDDFGQMVLELGGGVG
jgi:GNAT superfamily N-acetyltransferase